jgi:uncharacterized protein
VRPVCYTSTMEPPLEPRITLITLGVRDLERSVAFYHDGLGFPTEGIEQDEVAFFKLHGTWLSLYLRDKLARDTHNEDEVDGPGFLGFTIAHNVRSPQEVDAVLQRAAESGAEIIAPGAETSWGGYNGHFADPDGFVWEIAWNPYFWVD